MTAAAAGCPQAWHGGLAAGLLVECRHKARHRGWHRSADGSVQWGGKLTDIEQLTADALRAAPDPVVTRVIRSVDLYSIELTHAAGPPGTGIVSVTAAPTGTVGSPCEKCGGGNPLDGDNPVCQCGSEWARTG